MFCKPLVASILFLVFIAFSSNAEWLDFNAGTINNTFPLISYNHRLDELLTFDVELRGLIADTIEVDSVDYLRFNRTPGIILTDSVGLPELPIVRCFVWVPDSTHLSFSYAINCDETIGSIPVYPVPLDSIRADSCSPSFIEEFFQIDSLSYLSTDWYPDTLVRFIDEFHFREAG